MERLRPALLAVFGLCVPLRASDNAGYPSTGRGAIEFTVKPKQESFPLQKDILLLQGNSSDGSERYEIHVVAEDLLVLRDFDHCIRSAARLPHDFKKGKAYRFKLAWNQESTKFYVDGKEADAFNLMVVDKFPRTRAALRVGAGADFEIGGISVSADSPIARDPEDRDFVRRHSCPDMASLFDAPSQEEYRGTTLHNFPDHKSRDGIKRFIALLSPDMAAALKRVIFVPKAYNPNGFWKGRAFPGAGTMLLQDFAVSDPRVFFHEAAHLCDFRALQTEGKLKSQSWKERFQPDAAPKPMAALARGGSVLDETDASSPHEQLADFVGLAYEVFLKPGGGRFLDEFDNKARLDFIYGQGFITKAVYDDIRVRGR